LLHTLQVLYMCTICDSTNINTIIEFVPNCFSMSEVMDSMAVLIRTRGMSKLSSDRLNFARKGHETVARVHSYFVNIPEGVRNVLIAVVSTSTYCYLNCIVYDKLLKP
jgi:hypothetical protein